MKVDFKKLPEGFLKLKKKYKILIVAGLNLLIVAGFVLLSYYPKTERIKVLKDEVASLEDKVQKAKVRAAKLKVYEKEYQEALERLKQVSRVLPESSEIPTLLKTINRLGEECSLKFQLFLPEAPADRGEYFELPVNIEVKGAFHDVGRFLGLISSMERLFVAHSLVITPQYQPSVVVTARFKASTFWLKEAPGGKK